MIWPSITPRPLEQAIEQLQPEVIVTMGCGEECPVVPGAVRMDWDLPDPAGESIEFMKKVRDEIEKKVSEFLEFTVAQLKIADE